MLLSIQTTGLAYIIKKLNEIMMGLSVKRDLHSVVTWVTKFPTLSAETGSLPLRIT